MTVGQKAIFLDRDGVLILDKHYLKDPAGVELIPDVKDALVNMLQAGYLLFLFTNQSGVSRGYYTMDDVNACNDRMLDLLELPAPVFAEICVAPESPDDPQVYRKPSPKFILEMVDKFQLDVDSSWMLGDKLADVKAGINGGIKTAWIATGKPKDSELASYISEHDIPEFVSLNEFNQRYLVTT